MSLVYTLQHMYLHNLQLKNQVKGQKLPQCRHEFVEAKI